MSARARSSGVLLHVTSLPSGQARRGRVRLRRLAGRGGPVVVAAAAAPHPRRARLAVLLTLGVRRVRGPARRLPGSTHYDSGEGDEGAPQGDWLEEWVRSPASRERRAQTRFQREWLALKSYANERGIRLIGDIPLYVAGDSCDAITPSVALRPLGRRRRVAVPESSRGPALGHAGLRLAGARARRLRLVARAARARARAVRPAAHRPLPRPRQVLGATARRDGSDATASGARARASRSSTPPASGSTACR